MPSVPNPVEAPGGFVPEHVVAFGSAGGPATPVDAANPLPVAATILASAAVPLVGNSAASGLFGPFVPELGRTIWVTLSGSWSGSVQLLRSIDGDATKLPLTAGGQPWGAFTANANEPVGEESVAGASWWLAATLASGTLGFRVQQ